MEARTPLGVGNAGRQRHASETEGSRTGHVQPLAGEVQLNATIVSASIAGLVSVTVGTLSFFANRRATSAGSLERERQMQRRLTERLYELRLAAYPLAFEITGPLAREELFQNAETAGLVARTGDGLREWNRTLGALVMSKPTLKAYYEIREALAVVPSEAAGYDVAQLDRIWEAKNGFRRAMRRDLKLLYEEE